jgi:hypothetical protein
MLFPLVGTDRSRASTTEGGRFDRQLIARRLDVARAVAGIGQKEIGTAVWPNQKTEHARQRWNKQVNDGRDFFLGELEIAVDTIAAGLGKRWPLKYRGVRLPGFPFIDLDTSLELEHRDPAEVRKAASELPDQA